jgi:hypothetical protein
VDVADVLMNNVPAFLGYRNVLLNMAHVQAMQQQEKDWAAERERLRASGALRKRKGKPAQAETDTAGTDGPDEPEAVDVDDLKRRKRTAKDFRFYYLDPAYWEFMVDNKYRTIEAMKVTGFDDRTTIAGNVVGVLTFVYPMRWVRRFRYGSPRYAFRLDHLKLDAVKHTVMLRNRTVNTRLSRQNLKSLAFESLIDMP